MSRRKKKKDAMEAQGIQTQETPDLQKRDRRCWPEGEEMPKAYKKRTLLPCKICRRVLTDSGGQAVVVRTTKEDTAYLRCKVCDRKWSLPITPV